MVSASSDYLAQDRDQWRTFCEHAYEPLDFINTGENVHS
jgi:hypothetical protein